MTNLDKHPVLQPPVQPDCQTFPSIQKFPRVLLSGPSHKFHLTSNPSYTFWSLPKCHLSLLFISQSLSVPSPCRSMFEISHTVACVFSAFYFITGKCSIESMCTTVVYSLANWLTISKSQFMKIMDIDIIAIHAYVCMYVCMYVCAYFYFSTTYLGELCVMCQTVSEDDIIFTCSSTVCKSSVALCSFSCSNLHIIFVLKTGSSK